MPTHHTHTHHTFNTLTTHTHHTKHTQFDLISWIKTTHILPPSPLQRSRRPSPASPCFAWRISTPCTCSFVKRTSMLTHPPPTPPTRPPTAFPVPLSCQSMFASDIKSRSTCVAKAIIYLLGRAGPQISGGTPQMPQISAAGAAAPGAATAGQRQEPQQPAKQAQQAAGEEAAEAEAEAGVDPVLASMQSMAALLEQYYHPSNGGR